MIIQIIKGYGSYARLKFLVNLEPLNREPVNLSSYDYHSKDLNFYP
ncbi:MAG: hypothetical protein JRI72_11280 [Deltaproteobacteria bacterium]|nr:hypothetical protein [Deltaproteobacteria bacterium]